MKRGIVGQNRNLIAMNETGAPCEPIASQRKYFIETNQWLLIFAIIHHSLFCPIAIANKHGLYY